MKKVFLIISLIFTSNFVSAGLFKPTKPLLITDEVLIPEKQYVVKAFRVKQLADIEYGKSNNKIKGAQKKIMMPFYTIKFPKKHYLNKSKFEKKGEVNIATNIAGVSEENYKTITD